MLPIQTLPDVEIWPQAGTEGPRGRSSAVVAIAVPFERPRSNGYALVSLSRSQSGEAIAPALAREVVWRRGEPLPLVTYYVQDLPPAGRYWLNVRYADQVIAAGRVTIVG